MECIQADPVLFFTAVGTLIYLIYTGKLRPPHKPKPAAPVDLRPLTADQLYYAPLVALEAEEQRLIGIWLDSGCRDMKCRSRIDDVLAAKNWQVVGGPRPSTTTPSTPNTTTPSATMATRRSTALTVVPTPPAQKPLSSTERWKQVRHG